MKNYKGSDVKTGKGGYAQIRGIWLRLSVREDTYDENNILILPKALTVSKLAWGETFIDDLNNYAEEYRLTSAEIAELLETLTEEESAQAKKLGLVK